MASLGTVFAPGGPSAVRSTVVGGAVILVCVSMYAADRWLIAASAGHLLFHANPAEYALCEAILPFMDQPLLGVLSDTRTRSDLFAAVINSVDFPHGTLVLAALALMATVQWFDTELGTWTMRMLSLTWSTATLALWIGLLLHWTRSTGIAIRFALLYTLAPHVFVLVGLVYWGTHEWVCLLHAALLVMMSPFLGSEMRPAGAAAVAILAGATAAMMTVCNFSLLLPAGYVAAYFTVTTVFAHRRQHGPRSAALLGLGLVVSATAAFFVAYAVTLRLFDLPHLGYEARFDRNVFLESVFHEPLNWASPAAWSARVLSWGLLFLPSLKVDGNWRLVEYAVRALLLVAAAMICWQSIRGDVGGRSTAARKDASVIAAKQRKAGLFLASYLIVGWVAVGMLPFVQVNWGDQHVPLSLRYYSHLYPCAFAVLAIWSVWGRRFLRTLLLGAIVFIGASENFRLMDLGNTRAHRRYDAVALYLTRPHADLDLPRYVRFDQASPSFLAGYAYLLGFQDKGYWTFLTPSDVQQRPHQLFAFIDSNIGNASDHAEFLRGTGFALSVLTPPSRMDGKWESLRRSPAWDDEILEGYLASPESLEGP